MNAALILFYVRCILALNLLAQTTSLHVKSKLSEYNNDTVTPAF